MDRTDILKTFQKLETPPPPVLMYDKLDKLQECIYLYPGDDGVGHWCAILKHPDSWEIFDPIGLYPDTEIDNPRIKKVPKKLAHFFSEIPNEGIEYNDFALQRGGSDCALWCILRFLYRDLSCEQFENQFKDLTDFEICKGFNRMDVLY
jgi:hypothetical protein